MVRKVLSGLCWACVVLTLNARAAAAGPDVVLYAGDAINLHGNWARVASAGAAGGQMLTSADSGWSTTEGPLAAPTNYFEFSFDAPANVPFRVWARVRATSSSKTNDSLFVQFSDARNAAGSAVYAMGSTSALVVNLATDATAQSLNGWGWPNGAYWLAQTTTLKFATAGRHTLRVQTREDGVQIDQVVLSQSTYLTSAPGPVANDTTIVPKPIVGSTPYSTAIPLPGPVRIENFDNGGEGVAYHDTSAGNAGNVYRSTDVDLQASTVGGYNAGWTADGEWLAYSVNVATAGAYMLQLKVASPSADGRVHVTFGATATSTVAIPNTGGWQNWTNIFIPASLLAGPQVMKVVFDVGGFNLAGITATAVQSPGVPVVQTPAGGATGVPTNPTLAWSAAGATTYDVRLGTTNPPPALATGVTTSSYLPGSLANGTTYFWQVVARNASGSTAGPVWTFSTATTLPNGDIVIYASDVPAAALHGSWTTAADAASPNGIKLVTPDNGVANTNNPVAAPAHYVDVTFNAPAGTPYRIWLRMKALANSKYNDAVWLQFSDALASSASVYPIGTTSGLLVNLATDAGAASLNGWGWQNRAYWLTQPSIVSFSAGGAHTLRIQIREDGVQLDQIVLSPSKYLNAAPGLVTNDHTIVARSGTGEPPPTPPAMPVSPAPATAATGLSTTPTLTWLAPGATSYDVRFGTSPSPPTASSGQGAASFTPSTLAHSTTYFWQVVARNSTGTTTGPVWSFTTGAAGGASGTTWTVNAGDNLQAAINNAQPGDTILLQAGATFTGNFVLPAKTGGAFITIRSSASDALLPGPNTRITPSYAALLPKLKSATVAAALRTQPGAHHYRLMFLEFPGTLHGYYDIMQLGDGSSAQNTLSMVPYELVLDRVYVHGDPVIGQKRGIALNSASTTIANSYIAGIKSAGQDSQAIGGVNGPGPYTIVNNYLEAAGENILFGGSDPAIPNLVPSDILIRGNHLYKPMAWRSQQWTVKNLFELKNAQRVIVDGNVMENNWLGGQSGYGILLTPRNQDGGCPWCVVQDVQFTNNVIRHVAGGVNILGRDNLRPSQETNGIVLRNNLFENVSASEYGGQGRFLLITGGGRNITVDHNTVLQDGKSVVYVGHPVQNFVFTNNLAPDYSWAVMGDGQGPGNPTIATYFPNSTFAGNIFAGANASKYPTGNFYPASMAVVGFVSYLPLTGGNYHLALTSLYHNAGNDGKDVGADLDALNDAAGTAY